MSNVKVYSKATQGQNNLSKNFKVKEFACKDGTDLIKIDYELVCILQKIRDIGGVVIINSGYRTISYNKKVNGAKNSYHLKGQACDIKSQHLSLNDICAVANSLSVQGIILYNTFVHLDTRINKYHANSKGIKLNYNRYNIPYCGYLLSKNKKSKGTDVGIVQFKLNKIGYDCGIVDGIAGIKFEKAVREFQKKNMLQIDGIVGINTWNKLFN